MKRARIVQEHDYVAYCPHCLTMNDLDSEDKIGKIKSCWACGKQFKLVG